MKTNRKLQLIAAFAAILTIDSTARAQTPAPLSDEMLLHALATGQLGFTNDDFTLVNGGAPTSSQLGVGGGDDEKVAVFTPYGGAAYLQGQPAASYGGALYYGGGMYNNAAAAPPVNSWYNDFYGNAAEFTVDLDPGTAGYGGAIYRSTASSLIGEDLPGSQLTAAQADLRPTTASYGGAFYYGGGVYNNATGSAQLLMWYNDVYNNTSGNVTTGFLDSDGSRSDLRPTTASYGGAIYRSTASSLVGEDLPADALTDAQLDALILNVLAGVCDGADNCPTAPMPR